jgi:hypothetical protein
LAYCTKGVRIGDVGYVTQDGAFEMLFNIRASAEDPINQRGLPSNFERLVVSELDIGHLQHYHRPGGVVASMSALVVDSSESQNPCVLSTCHTFIVIHGPQQVCSHRSEHRFPVHLENI